MDTIRKPVGTLTKKRYREFEEHLHAKYANDNIDVHDILSILCNVLQFDPNVSSYTPEIGKKKYANFLKRCEETGKSTYEMLHSKKLASRHVN